MSDTHPSKAFINERGRYIHDPENQHLAEMEKQGKTGAQPFANRQHPTPISGYCEHGKLGGIGCAACPK